MPPDAMLREVATDHAETIIHLHLRADGSFIQSSSLVTITLTRRYLTYWAIPRVICALGSPGVRPAA